MPYVRRMPARRSANLKLSGLSGIDLDGRMVSGGSYSFYFNIGRLGLAVDPADVTKWVATDSNFKNPGATVQSGWLTNQIVVAFTYNGRGSNVRNAGLEMQNVINSRMHLTKLYFDSADGPVAGPDLPGLNPAGNGAGNNNGAGPYSDLLALLAARNAGNQGNQAKPIPWGTIALVGGAAVLGTVGIVKLAQR